MYEQVTFYVNWWKKKTSKLENSFFTKKISNNGNDFAMIGQYTQQNNLFK